MNEIIEIKRKEFEVISYLGERTKVVTRKNKKFFLKDFGEDKEGFQDYIDGEHRCRINGVSTPKVVMYDKNSRIVISEFKEGETVLDILMNEDLKEEIFKDAFQINWYAKHGKMSIDFKPENFIWDGNKLWYTAQVCSDYQEKYCFEKRMVFLWFYGEDLVNHLKNKCLDIDYKRANVDKGYINKQVALTVVKFYK